MKTFSQTLKLHCNLLFLPIIFPPLFFTLIQYMYKKKWATHIKCAVLSPFSSASYHNSIFAHPTWSTCLIRKIWVHFSMKLSSVTMCSKKRAYLMHTSMGLKCKYCNTIIHTVVLHFCVCVFFFKLKKQKIKECLCWYLHCTSSTSLKETENAFRLPLGL